MMQMNAGETIIWILQFLKDFKKIEKKKDFFKRIVRFHSINIISTWTVYREEECVGSKILIKKAQTNERTLLQRIS